MRPGVVVHGYRIDRKLGSGGYGQVYLAWQDGRPFALKFIRLKEAEGWAKRELSILLYLRHPHVVRLVGHVEGPEQAPDYLVLVMEYVEGRSLYAWADEENVSARQVVRMLLTLCVAVAVVHAAEVLHRDLKGDNVLVRDSDGEPVLVDFGVSGVPWAPRVTPDLLPPCTPAYRSPECVRFLVDWGLPEDARYTSTKADDLYALGVTLYVLLTGAYPFEGRDGLELKGRILREVPRAPHELNPRVPRALSDLCMRLLDKDPQARFASAEALGGALEALLAEADESWDVSLLDRRRMPTPAPAPVAVPVPDSAPPAVEAPRPAVRMRPPWVGALCGLLLAGLLGVCLPHLAQCQRPDAEPVSTPAPSGPALAALLHAVFPDTVPTLQGSFFREVAPPWRPPEAGSGAAPPRADTPAPVVPATTHRKGETRLKMKKKDKALDTREDKNAAGAGKALGWCIGAAAAFNAACVGAEAQVVRPVPHPQDCPEQAISVMSERFHIPIRGEAPLFLPGTNLDEPKATSIPVQEGPVTLYLGNWWGKLPPKTYLSGRLIIGPERVYGRITEAQLPGGEVVPVCFALKSQDIGAQLGLPIEATVGPGTVKVFPYVRAEAVRRFE